VIQEKEDLEKALSSLIQNGYVRLEWLAQPHLDQLHKALRHRPHFVHFIGHGSFNSDQNESELLFEDRVGRLVRVSARKFAMLLKDSLVRFVFLNTCGSGFVPSGIAETLVRRGVLAALGMSALVPDTVAITFARGFYEALSENYSVEAALVEGRKAIVISSINYNPDRPDWAHPVLYTRAADGRLFR